MPFEPTFIIPATDTSENEYVRGKEDTYANMAFFRFRLSFFATERCCLRLAAASGLVANCRTAVNRQLSCYLLDPEIKTCLRNAGCPPLTLYPQHCLPNHIVGDSELGCANFPLD
jgi:hypothetical protein